MSKGQSRFGRSGGADVRERILETASALFYKQGVRAVGVDLVVEKAGVAKTSLYRHFGTKDDLVAAFLEREDQDFWGGGTGSRSAQGRSEGGARRPSRLDRRAGRSAQLPRLPADQRRRRVPRGRPSRAQGRRGPQTRDAATADGHRRAAERRRPGRARAGSSRC